MQQTTVKPPAPPKSPKVPKAPKPPKAPKAPKDKGALIVNIKLGNTSHHPLLDLLPPIDLDGQEMRDLIGDIRAKNVINPVLVVPGAKPGQWLLIDGRNREYASKQSGREEIPAIIKKEEEARDIILSALIHRKHFCKGALAYICVPLLTQAAEAARAKKTAFLKKGDQDVAVGDGLHAIASLEEECAKMGFSVDLYQQASRLRAIFAENLDYKTLAEPKILSGEVGLGAAIAGAAGRAATRTKDKPATRYLFLSANGRPMGLMPRALTSLSNGIEAWGRMDLEARAAFKKEWDSLMSILPQDLK